MGLRSQTPVAASRTQTHRAALTAVMQAAGDLQIEARFPKFKVGLRKVTKAGDAKWSPHPTFPEVTLKVT